MQAEKQVSQQQQAENQPLQKAIRILSLDGGGIRGVAVARILQEIEEKTGKRIHELFDVVVGTSTGGLLAVMMTVEIPPADKRIPEPDKKNKKEHAEWKKLDDKRERQEQMRRLGRNEGEVPPNFGLKAGEVMTAEQAKECYKLKAKHIFHENAGWLHKFIESTNEYVAKIVHWSDTKYEKGDGLKEIVRALYIQNSIDQARTCTGVVVTERGFNMPILLSSTNAKVKGRHNYHNNLSLAKLVRATSAAPTYFKAVHIHNPVVDKKHEKEKTPKEVEKEKESMNKSSSYWDQEVIEYKFCQRKTLFFEDGGVTCNNPSLKGFRYAKELLKIHGENPDDYEFQIYSIGTGAFYPGTDAENLPKNWDEPDPAHETIEKLEAKGGKVESGVWDSLRRLAFEDPFAISRQSYKNHIKVQERLKFFEKRAKERVEDRHKLLAKLGIKTPEKTIKHQYFRLQFRASKDQLAKLDASNDDFIKGLIAAAEESIRVNPVLKKIIASLETPVERPKGLNNLVPDIKIEESELFQCI